MHGSILAKVETSSLPSGKLFSASLIYTVGDFLTTAISGFLLIPVYLHYMTPADYGIYSTVTVLINMLGVLLAMGLGSALGRFYFLYRDRGEEYRYLGSIWLFQILVSLALVVALALWGSPLWAAICPEIPFRPYIWFVLAGSFLTFSASVYPLWLRVLERPVAFVILQVAGTAAFALSLGVFLILLRQEAQGALGAAIFSNALIALVGLVALGRKATWRIQYNLLRPSLDFGRWMVIGTFGYFFLNKSQLFFLQHYGDMASVGVYNLGLQLGGILTLLALSFAKAWQPFVYSAKTSGEAADAISSTSKYFVAVMLYGMLGIAVLSNEILRVVAKPDYFKAGIVIRLVAIASFVYVLSNLTNTGLFYMKRPELAQAAMLLSAGLNVVLNMILIPRWQMVGAALAMLAAFSVMVISGFFLVQKVMHVKYDWAMLVKITGIGTGLLVTEWLLIPQRIGFLESGIRVALLAAFPLLLWLGRVFSKSEIKAILSQISTTLSYIRRALKRKTTVSRPV
ncbi:MAG TPA: hypothetical protein DDZ40_00190 [Deltaproteobacteria bacterium]|nr:hypothetical protein [Deltaproteobacteria bacterium]